MTAQEIIEKIRAEVERQREEIRPTDTGEMKVVGTPTQLEQGWLNALSWMEKVLDTLQEQPVDTSEDERINTAIFKALSKKDARDVLKECGVDVGDALDYLKRQSKEQPVKKMLTAEDCPYRSSRVLHDERGEFHLCYEQGLDCECIPNGCPYLIMKNSKIKLPDIPGYVVRENAHEKERNEMLSKIDEEKIKALKEQPASEELEEAAERYEHNRVYQDELDKYANYLDSLEEGETPRMEEPSPETKYLLNADMIESFKAGAKWQKEQMMKEAVEGVVSLEFSDGTGAVRTTDGFVLNGLRCGQKVPVIIVKGN